MEIPTLKAGKNSTEFIGKVILQLVIVVNLGLRFFELPSLNINPEESIAIAGAIEVVWMLFRQWNKRLELTSRTAILVADKAIGLEHVKAESRLTEIKTKNEFEMERSHLNEAEK